MRYNGKIKELNHIVISDPSYDKSVTCRYEREDIKAKDWIVDIDIYKIKEPVNEKITIEGTQFYILLHNPKIYCELKEEGTFRYFSNHKITEIDIGIDRHCIGLGINKNAKEINNWKPNCSLETLSDGIFGTVKEGRLGEKINFIWISGYLHSDTGYSFKDILDYLSNQLEITDLKCNELETQYEEIEHKIDEEHDLDY